MNKKQLISRLVTIVLLCGILYCVLTPGPWTVYIDELRDMIASTGILSDTPSDDPSNDPSSDPSKDPLNDPSDGPSVPVSPDDPAVPNDPEVTPGVTPGTPPEDAPDDPGITVTPGEGPTQPIDPPNVPDGYQYAADISAYLDAICTSYDSLLLVNKQHPLGSTYVPGNLVDLNRNLTAGGKPVQLDATAATALNAMMLCMRADGITDTYVTSGYRSYQYQKSLQDKYVQDEQRKDPSLSKSEALGLVHEYSAPPGKSEHQSGLCVDFITTGMAGNLTNSFESYAAFEWLQENARYFGFILRYPEDKVGITQYSYESWHYRFVGRDAAIAITEAGLTLEEYLNTLN